MTAVDTGGVAGSFQAQMPVGTTVIYLGDMIFPNGKQFLVNFQIKESSSLPSIFMLVASLGNSVFGNYGNHVNRT